MKTKKFLNYFFSITSVGASLLSCNVNNQPSSENVDESVQVSLSEEVNPTIEQSTNSIEISSEEQIQNQDSLKVLCIGNSFSVDTVEYVPNIALDLGYKSVKFANLYIGGCSIDKHFENAMKNNANYEYFVNTGTGWSSSRNHSILSALESEEWDYISIQHGTGDGSRYADIKSYLNLEDLIWYIQEHTTNTPKIVFNMTWVGEKGSHEELVNVFNNDTQAYYNAIVDLTFNKLTAIDKIDIISPTGTAIQNARTAAIGSLTRDNYHLSLTTGRYTAALTFFMALTKLDVSNINYTPLGMNQYMKDVSIEAALNAINNPTNVISSKIEVPEFEWPSDVEYGKAATPNEPFYNHAAKQAPEVSEKIDLLKYINLLPTLPIITSTLQSPNNMGLTIDLNKTPYLYYSFIIPEGSDFTFSIYSDTTYSPWLTFLDQTSGNAKLNHSAETWDQLYANNRAQYATKTQTGCIDLRQYANKNAQKWIISMFKLYAPKQDGVIISYFFIGSEK